LRRQAQLHALRGDLEVIPLRGNVDTRLCKLQSGEFDAIILACAGVSRLGLTELVRMRLNPQQMCPAAGQGALAIEARSSDAATIGALKFLDHARTRAAVESERAALNALGGGCQVPIGAYASHENGELTLQAVVASPDGKEITRAQRSGSDPQKLGREVGEELLANGAMRILASVYGTAASVPQQP
jgi:hydroxymethylbilane synthase